MVIHNLNLNLTLNFNFNFKFFMTSSKLFSLSEMAIRNFNSKPPV